MKCEILDLNLNVVEAVDVMELTTDDQDGIEAEYTLCHREQWTIKRATWQIREHDAQAEVVGRHLVVRDCNGTACGAIRIQGEQVLASHVLAALGY